MNCKNDCKRCGNFCEKLNNGYLSILDVSRKLGFTKNAVKYHLKFMPCNLKVRTNDNRIFISPDGVQWLQNKMKRSKKNVYDEVELLKTKVDCLLAMNDKLISILDRR